MKKLLIIEQCDDCKHFEFDNQERPLLWSKAYCHKLERILSDHFGNEIQEDCPLENA